MSHHNTETTTFRAAVITVSDTRTRADDKSGDAAERLLVAAGHSVTRAIVRDEQALIRDAILATHEDVIVLTGGTGVAARDVTYEVVASMLDKTLDGFGEAFRRLSWDEIGPRAVLSRAIAGTRGKTMIVALPGSTKAVELGVSRVLLPIASHVIGLLRG
jgi:molybdopterin adenylyltransferase